MDIKELANKTEKELKDTLKDAKLRLGQFKFELSSRKLKNTNQIGALRRDIARIMTILNNRK